MATNPNVSQGTLNRIRASVIIPAFPTLKITSSFMGKGFVTTRPHGPYTTFVETGTGQILSPEPYVIFTITVDLLRTQALSGAWLAQIQASTILGIVDVHPDSAAFPRLKFRECGVEDFDPGAMDGKSPTVPLVIRGKLNVNNNLWNMT
jgi:hypothetical protein